MTIESTWQDSIFRVRVPGVLGAKESAQLFEDYYSDPRSQAAEGILFDCSNCERFEFSDGEIAQMSALEYGGSRGLSRVKIAFVAATPEIRAFYDRYVDFYETVYEKVDAQWEIELFDELEAAERWLTEKN